MGKTNKLMILTAGAVLTLSGLAPNPLLATSAKTDLVAQGKQVAFDRKKGNCLSCHMMADGESPGDLGPPLIAMQARFPDAGQLKAQIVDPTQKNPGTRMPPFGRYGILSEAEIEAIVAYLYTL